MAELEQMDMNETRPPAAGDTVDLLIAGLGPGGCAAALAAQAAGLRTVAVEARGPEATRSQLVLVRPGAQAALRSIGLPDVTEGRRTSSIRQVENRLRDAVMAAAQADPALTLHWHTSVSGLQVEADGVRLSLRDEASGAERQLRARHVIDASGGRLEALGRPVRERRGPRHWVIAAEYEIPPWFEGIVGVRDPAAQEMFLMFPTWGRRGVICYHDAPPGRELDATAFAQRFERAAAQLALGAPLQPVAAVDVVQRLLPRPSSDRVLPIGDALGTVDVLLGAGMSTAIEDGVDAARAIALAQRMATPAEELACTQRLAARLYARHRSSNRRGRWLLAVRPWIERAWPRADLEALHREQAGPPPLLWPAVRFLFGRRPRPSA